MLAALCFVVVLDLEGSPEVSRSPPRVIIHADDFGMSHSVNRATMKGLEEGLITSASIMIPCPWVLEVAEYARRNPEKDLGIHLTLTSEWKHYRWRPVAPRHEVPGLIDREGYLHRSVFGVIAQAGPEEVRAEIRAQIDRAIELGIRPTHLDSHMGVLFARPDYFQVFLETALEYDIPPLVVRPEALRGRPVPPGLLEKAGELLPRLEDRGFPILDGIETEGTDLPPEAKVQHYDRYISGRTGGIVEIIVHCGFDDPELRAITSSSRRRQGDLEAFTNPDLMKRLGELPVELIGWRDLREAARKDD